MPLRFALYARHDSTPVLELTATNISYGAVPASAFSMKAPSGARVVNVDLPAMGAGADKAAASKRGARVKKPTVSGAGPVAARVSFPLDAPAAAGGFTRSEVRLLGTGSKASALVIYGRGLGAVAVVEHKAGGKAPNLSTSSGGDQPGLSLPTVSVAHGASAQELGTALGTVLTFTRGGVSYTVIGSVTAATARAVANAL